MDVKTKIKALSREYFNEVVEYRRHIHANPELAFEEFGTAEFVSTKLNEFGIPHTKGVAKTGIIALLEGRTPVRK